MGWVLSSSEGTHKKVPIRGSCLLFERSFRFLKKNSERCVPTDKCKFFCFSEDRPHTDKVGLLKLFMRNSYLSVWGKTNNLFNLLNLLRCMATMVEGLTCRNEDGRYARYAFVLTSKLFSAQYLILDERHRGIFGYFRPVFSLFVFF